MSEVVLFHHVQGLTDGVLVARGGHTVHTPDLFDGERPATNADGVAHDELAGRDPHFDAMADDCHVFGAMFNRTRGAAPERFLALASK